MVAVTDEVCRGPMEAIVAGAKVTFQPSGGVEVRVTPVNGDEPVLVTMTVTVPVLPEVTVALRTWFGVLSDSEGLPVIVTWRSTLAVVLPAAAVTWMG